MVPWIFNKRKAPTVTSHCVKTLFSLYFFRMAEDGKHGPSSSIPTRIGKTSGLYELFEERLKKSLGVDPRYSVLDFESSKNYLHIFTDSIPNAIRISRVYRKESPGFRIKVVLLPDRTVGEFTKGICHVGVAPVRREDDPASEQVTQVLYGETFDSLQVADDWIRVRLHADGYIGWVSSNQVTLFDESDFCEFQALPKVYVIEKVLSLLERPNRNSSAHRESVYGTALSIVGRRGKFLEVKLPDGSVAYAEESGVKDSSFVRDFSLKGLLDTANRFQGTSYVWGGRSAKGFDCSGFVQTVFRLNGVELPRDSSVQFSAGKFVGKKLRNLQPGDLLFFSHDGSKISHVALYIGKNKKFIHSSGFVRVNSFDPRRKDFNEKLFATFVGACRVT